MDRSTKLILLAVIIGFVAVFVIIGMNTPDSAREPDRVDVWDDHMHKLSEKGGTVYFANGTSVWVDAGCWTQVSGGTADGYDLDIYFSKEPYSGEYVPESFITKIIYSDNTVVYPPE